MATQATQKGIKNSWSFFEFCRANGKMKRGTFTTVDPDTHQPRTFQSLVFPDSPKGMTFLSFSSNLGELSHAELKAQRADLQVVELESGTFKLCRKGEGAWEDEDIWD